MIGTLKQYANLIFAGLFVLIVATAYIKGRFDGKSSAVVKDYKQQVAAYEGAMERSRKAYEAAYELQALDIQAAIKASEERQIERLQAMQRTNELNASLIKNPPPPNCVLDTGTLEILNKSLKGGKK